MTFLGQLLMSLLSVFSSHVSIMNLQNNLGLNSSSSHLDQLIRSHYFKWYFPIIHDTNRRAYKASGKNSWILFCIMNFDILMRISNEIVQKSVLNVKYFSTLSEFLGAFSYAIHLSRWFLSNSSHWLTQVISRITAFRIQVVNKRTSSPFFEQ